MKWFTALWVALFWSSPSTGEIEVTGTENEFPENDLEDYVNYDEYLDDDMMDEL